MVLGKHVDISCWERGWYACSLQRPLSCWEVLHSLPVGWCNGHIVKSGARYMMNLDSQPALHLAPESTHINSWLKWTGENKCFICKSYHHCRDHKAPWLHAWKWTRLSSSTNKTTVRSGTTIMQPVSTSSSIRKADRKRPMTSRFTGVCLLVKSYTEAQWQWLLQRPYPRSGEPSRNEDHFLCFHATPPPPRPLPPPATSPETALYHNILKKIRYSRTSVCILEYHPKNTDSSQCYWSIRGSYDRIGQTKKPSNYTVCFTSRHWLCL